MLYVCCRIDDEKEKAADPCCSLVKKHDNINVRRDEYENGSMAEVE